jgi:hypothetical protein
VGGAIAAVGERAGGNGLGVALAGVFAVSLVSALLGLLGSRRIGGFSSVQNPVPAGVD